MSAMADHNSRGQLRRLDRETAQEKKPSQQIVRAVINREPPKLIDEKATRLLIRLREGRTHRSLHITSAQLKAYSDAHPEYAKEALPLFEANAGAATRARARACSPPDWPPAVPKLHQDGEIFWNDRGQLSLTHLDSQKEPIR
jgi:hypothetical protein